MGEIFGGSQREERLEVLDRNMAERGIDGEHYAPTLIGVKLRPIAVCLPLPAKRGEVKNCGVGG